MECKGTFQMMLLLILLVAIVNQACVIYFARFSLLFKILLVLFFGFLLPSVQGQGNRDYAIGQKYPEVFSHLRYAEDSLAGQR